MPADHSEPYWLRPRRRLLIAAGVLVAISAIYLLVSYLVVSATLTTQRVAYKQTPADSGLPTEEVQFESDVDRIPLVGWLLGSSRDRAIVLGHGLNCYGWSGSQPDLASALVNAGFRVLVFDFRGHGRSGGDRLGLGWDESRDVRAAVDLLLGRGFEPGNIGIDGGSYGAATALLAAAAIPEIGAVVADSAFADMRDIMERQIKERTGVPIQIARLLRPGIAFLARLLYSLDFDAIPPVRAVSDIAPRPILFIHGDEDRTIPVEHAYRLKAASQNPADELCILRGFGHTEGIRRHGKGCKHGEPSPTRDVYLKKVVEFFDGTLRQSRRASSEQTRRAAVGDRYGFLETTVREPGRFQCSARSS